jgi:diadenosine tetraphosphatase ApaH/serine/threonine PP2A family protein phosphatase
MQGGFLVTQHQEVTFRPTYQDGNSNESWEIGLDRPGKYLINPGSIGQPRDGDWRASFAVFDSDARKVTFHRVIYDIAKAQQRIRDAKLPERLAERLVHGR